MSQTKALDFWLLHCYSKGSWRQ